MLLFKNTVRKESMKQKQSPEIIEVSVTRLEGIKSRLSSGCLLEEDKPVLLAIVSAYVWLQEQLESAKLTINRLKKIFGFSTEKQKKGGKTGGQSDLKLDLASLGTPSKEQGLLGESPMHLQESATKK